MIPVIRPLDPQKIFENQASKPYKIIGDDFNVYFVKYLLNGAGDYKFLLYEILCQQMARYFEIPVPDIAYMETGEYFKNSQNQLMSIFVY